MPKPPPKCRVCGGGVKGAREVCERCHKPRRRHPRASRKSRNFIARDAQRASEASR